MRTHSRMKIFLVCWFRRILVWSALMWVKIAGLWFFSSPQPEHEDLRYSKAIWPNFALFPLIHVGTSEQTKLNIIWPYLSKQESVWRILQGNYMNVRVNCKENNCSSNLTIWEKKTYEKVCKMYIILIYCKH